MILFGTFIIAQLFSFVNSFFKNKKGGRIISPPTNKYKGNN